MNFPKIELTAIKPEEIKQFSSEADFIGLSVDLMIETGSYICVVGNLMPNKTRAWDSDQAVLGGHLVRLYKLISAMLDQTCQMRREISFVFARLAFECIINLRFLLKNYGQDVLLTFKSYSLKHEKKLMNKIEENIKNRNGDILPIENRMIDSISRSFKVSGVKPEDIKPKELKNWGGKNIYEKADDVGLSEAYLAAFGGPSHNVHGNWQDLLEYHLEDTENGHFKPDFDWHQPRPQYLNVVAVHSIEALKEYISFLKIDEVSDINDKIKKLQKRVLLLDSLHEEWLAKNA